MKKEILMLSIMFFSFSFSNGISGVSYFGYYMNNVNSDREDDKTQGFALNRVYFTYKNQISEKASFKFQADMQNKNTTETTAYYMFIKKAQIDLSIFDGAKMSIGMIGMNMLNVAEKNWGNRFLMKSSLDLNKWSATADLGMGLSYKFGSVLTSLLVTNGEGYKSVAKDDNQKISFQAVYGNTRLDKSDGFNVGMVYSTLNYESEPGVINEETGKYDTKPVDKTASVLGLFGGFSGFGARVGLDYSMGTDLYLESNSGEIYGESATLMSFYLNYDLSFVDHLSFMFRYDTLDAGVEDNMDTEGNGNDESVNDDTSLMMFGFLWKCTDGVVVSPNVTQTTYGDKDPVTNLGLSFQFKF